MQNEQYLLQPSITETNAVGPLAPGAGRRSNFSISGKLTSTRGPRARSTSSSIPGTRCRVRGPKTMSTWGARARIASPSWLATHPPTPMTTSGRRRLSARQRPSSENTFSWAFSRTEHVLTRSTSASSGRSARSSPCEWARASAVRAESYSFIWHP